MRMLARDPQADSLKETLGSEERGMLLCSGRERDSCDQVHQGAARISLSRADRPGSDCNLESYKRGYMSRA